MRNATEITAILISMLGSLSTEKRCMRKTSGSVLALWRIARLATFKEPQIRKAFEPTPVPKLALCETQGCACPLPLSTSGQCVRFQQRYALTGFLACGCQSLVECHQRSIRDLADRAKIAIAQRFRRRQPGNRTGCRTEGHVKFKRLLPDSDSRILEPPVVHLPGFANGTHILAH